MSNAPSPLSGALHPFLLPPFRTLAGLAFASALPLFAASSVSTVPANAVLPAPASPQLTVSAAVDDPYHDCGEPLRLTYIRVVDTSSPTTTYYLAPGNQVSTTPVLLLTASATLTFTDPRSLPAGTRSYAVTVFQTNWEWVDSWIGEGWVDDWDWVGDEFVIVGSHWEDGHWDGHWSDRDDWSTLAAHTVTFTLTGATLQFSQSAGSSTYQPGGTVTVTATLTFSGVPRALGVDVMIPTGWSYAGGGGNEGGVKPSPGATDFLEWAWLDEPASPVVFSYTLNVPAGQSGAKQILGDAVLRTFGTLETAISTPITLHLLTQ